MDIILIRHGEKIATTPDNESPLSQRGIAQIDHLKEQLTRRNLRPEIYLSSKFKRALQTAERLSNNVYPIDALTPSLNSEAPTLPIEKIFQNIIQEAHKQGIELDQQTTFGIVGHDPGLGQMLEFLTSTPAQPIDTGKGVWITATSLSDFLQGQGRIQECID